MKRPKQAEAAAFLQVRQLGGDILASGPFQDAKRIPHHGSVSVARHSLHVAARSLRIATWLEARGVSVDTEDVVRAALLHDIGMTDRSVQSCPPWIKAYTHPRRGAVLAERQFRAGPVQRDAILHHMWPVCVIPPRHLSGWVVLLADKLCSVEELKTNIRSRRIK